MSSYQKFLETKQVASIQSGFTGDLSSYPLFDYQYAIVDWALRRGRAAIFADTGLGKTIMQTAWADQVVKHTGKPVLLLAPLAVSYQTVKKSAEYGIAASLATSQSDVTGPGIYVTNYEKLDHFDAEAFAGVVLDESSILKGMNGSTRQKITEAFCRTPYRLSCTATPSPNDHMELGTQSEFLGVMRQLEMLAMYFIHDGGDTSKWRLKGHGVRRFWEWVSTWAVLIRKPSDLGFNDEAHELPDVIYHEHIIETDPEQGLFVDPAQSLMERNQARRDSVDDRVALAARIASEIDDSVLVWCNLNDEAEKLSKGIDGAVEVRGSDSDKHKEHALLGFSEGDVQKLITKPKIAGFGMDWSHCNQMVFVGLSDSWEQYYQAVRRCQRFGQKRQVHVHVVSADTEGAVVANIKEKDRKNEEMAKQMVSLMAGFMRRNVLGATTEKTEYAASVDLELPSFLRAA